MQMILRVHDLDGDYFEADGTTSHLTIWDKETGRGEDDLILPDADSVKEFSRFLEKHCDSLQEPDPETWGE